MIFSSFVLWSQMEAKDIYVGTLAQYAKVGFSNIVVNDLIDSLIIFIYDRMSIGESDRNINWVGRGKGKKKNWNQTSFVLIFSAWKVLDYSYTKACFISRESYAQFSFLILLRKYLYAQ